MTDSKSEVKVRKMVAADLPRVNEIDRGLKGGGRVTTWPFSFESYWSVYEPEYTYVAEINDEVVGFLVGYIKPMEGTHTILRRADMQVIPRTRHQMVGWIEMMGVPIEWQGKGVGRALVDTFDKECQKYDALISSLVRMDDKTLADFYKGIGFRPWETVVYFRPWTKE